MAESNDDSGKRVAVHVRRILDGSGDHQVDLGIYCPVKAAELSLDECRGCEHHGGVEGPSDDQRQVVCNHPQQVQPPTAPRGTLADKTPVAEVMTRSVFCVRPDVSIETITALMLDRGFSGVPVVDKHCRPVGMISKTDLVRAEHQEAYTAESERREIEPGIFSEELVRGTVGDIMTPVVLTVGASDSLSQAAALMAAQRVHRVPVVRRTVVVGMLSALDVLRWLGEQDGYLSPA